MKFRPCIDLYQGTVKQIIGGSYMDTKNPKINFSSEYSPSWFARKYAKENLTDGHVIKIGKGNDNAAKEALNAWPNGFQIGGGITIDNAKKWIDKGAKSVIVTSWIFSDKKIDLDKIIQLSKSIGKERIVIDLSCRKNNNQFYVVKDRWQTFTETKLNLDTFNTLSKYCNEFLIHAVDVEGKKSGIDEDLVNKLAIECPIPCVYAGGISSMNDLKKIASLGKNQIDITIGSALDIFGGRLSFNDVVNFCS
ncbi:MAG: phosphoribosylformimino-5-aminoimidazole carboxamide ribotide isomerase [Pontiellaceae bacterium]